MEDLFSTHLTVNGHKVSYHVVFDQEQYVFTAEGAGDPRTFSFRREHDEWHDQSHLPHELRKQAVEALEKYLLRQH